MLFRHASGGVIGKSHIPAQGGMCLCCFRHASGGPFLLCWAWLHGVSCRSPRRVSGLSHGNKSTLVLGPLGKGLLDRDFSFRLCEDTDWLFDFGSKPGCRR